MRILAVDTATTSCSVAVVENQHILAEYTRVDGRTHSVNLMVMVEIVLAQCGLTPGDLFGIGVSVGPGTFTGLRIGIAAMKGLGYGANKPVLGVNSLDALAYPLKNLGVPVVSLIDARRGEVYYAFYNSIDGVLVINGSHHVASPEEMASNIPKDSILVGNGAVAYSNIFKKKLRKAEIRKRKDYNLIRASSVAFLAADRFAIGENNEIGTLTPYYIRKADVQLSSSK